MVFQERCLKKSRKNLKRIKYRIPNKTLLGKLLSFFGIHLNKRKIGYFHTKGNLMKTETGNIKDIVIIEEENGQIICIPNNEKYYSIIYGDFQPNSKFENAYSKKEINSKFYKTIKISDIQLRNDGSTENNFINLKENEK